MRCNRCSIELTRAPYQLYRLELKAHGHTDAAFITSAEMRMTQHTQVAGNSKKALLAKGAGRIFECDRRLHRHEADVCDAGCADSEQTIVQAGLQRAVTMCAAWCISDANAQTLTMTGTETSHVLPGTSCSHGRPDAALTLTSADSVLRES